MEFSPKKSKSNIYCCVNGCKSRACKNDTVRFYHFPQKNEIMVFLKNKYNQVEQLDRFEAWMKVLKMGKPVSNTMRVCSLHFVKEDFVPSNCKVRRLKKNSIPSVNLPSSSNYIVPNPLVVEQNYQRVQKEQHLKNQTECSSSELIDGDIEKEGTETTTQSSTAENHHDINLSIEQDMENYRQYKMGFSQTILMVKGTMPSKFDCQIDRRKRLSDTTLYRKAYMKRLKGDTQAATNTPETSTQAAYIKRLKVDIGQETQAAADTPKISTLQNGETISSIVTEKVYIKEELMIDDELIDIKEEPIFKEEPIVSIEDESILFNYELRQPIDTVKIDKDFNNDCLQFANYVGIQLQKLTDYNSLSVAKKCIQSIILAAQNGFYKNGVIPSNLTTSVDDVVNSELENGEY